MSSTNRSAKRSDQDYYVTPIDDIVHFLTELDNKSPGLFLSKKILDSCAGGSNEDPMSYPEALKKIGVKFEDITTLDIREDSHAQIKCDFLDWCPDQEYDIIISNPPFAFALEFIKKGLEIVKDDGYVIMLLRLNFFGAQKRKPFWQSNMPKYTFVHSKRMSFVKHKSTDSVEYMHAVWQKNNTSDCKIYVI